MSTSQVNSKLTRRRFLTLSPAAVAAAGAAPLVSGASAAFAGHTEHAAGPDYYDKLGVTKIINAAGTYTFLTASIMPPSVRQAVAQAALHPVRFEDLQKAAGTYIAKRLRCESALVSCGASSALTLATAAAVQAANNCKPSDIPQNVPGLKNQVIMQKAQRYDYDHAIFLTGAKVVEVDTMDDYKNALGSNAVMAHFFNAAPHSTISREDWIAAAHDHGVPATNAAAADMPPISHLWDYTEMGFDMVMFSGGKGIRGPQNAGLLLGKKKYIDLAVQNGNPNDEAVARGMKVAKEQIVGMVAAVDWILDQTDEGLEREFTRRANVVIRLVGNIPTMKATIFVPPIANHVPHVLLTYDPATVGLTPREVQQLLRTGTPSIELNPATGSRHSMTGQGSGENTIVVGVWMLQPGEEFIVGRELHKVLSNANKA